MFELLLSKLIAFLSAYGLGLLGVSTIGALITLLLGKFLTTARLAVWGQWSENGGVRVGKFITANMSEWPLMKTLWNKTFEPYAVVIIESTAVRFLVGLVKGMKSDNKKD